MLTFLYVLIKYFGKDVVNYLILVYLAIGGATGMKSLLLSLTGTMFQSLDENNLVDFKILG